MENPFSKKAPSQQEAFLRTYLDRIAPGIVKFEVDHYIFGSTYRCVWRCGNIRPAPRPRRSCGSWAKKAA